MIQALLTSPATLWALITLLLCFACMEPASATEITANHSTAYLVEIDGAIGPVTQELIVCGIEGYQHGASMVILQMNTPGGLDHSMLEIYRAILDAHVDELGSEHSIL